jgi:hypothetical protein
LNNDESLRAEKMRIVAGEILKSIQKNIRAKKDY